MGQDYNEVQTSLLPKKRSWHEVQYDLMMLKARCPAEVNVVGVETPGSKVTCSIL